MANGLSAANLRSLSAKCTRLAEDIGDGQIAAALKEMAAEVGSMADCTAPAVAARPIEIH